MIGYIYLWTNNKNQKKYIGETTQDPWIRWGAERNAAYNRKQNTYSLPLSRAIRKYGYQGFKRTVIDTVEADTEKQVKAMLHELEKFYIWYYRSFVDWGNGYNATTGGKDNYQSKETKQKKANANKGSKRSEKTKKILSEQKMGEKNPNYGIPKTDQQKEYLSQVVSEQWKDPELAAARSAGFKRYTESITLDYLCIETGQIFHSSKAAAEFAGTSDGKIIACCKFKRRTTGGYHWCYANNPLTIEQFNEIYESLRK